MPRKYKMPRTFKSDETYQAWLEGKSKAGNTPRNITPELREKYRLGGIIKNRNKILRIAEQKETYNTQVEKQD